jgi:WD40 repeat protein
MTHPNIATIVQSIEDIRFSPDGTTLAVANGNSVVFWDLSQLTEMGTSRGPVRTVSVDGELVSTIFFVGRTDQMNETRSSSSLSSYVIIATRRNTRLHLRDIEDDTDMQTITFLPPSERRLSLAKAFRKETQMFNCVGFDLRTQILVVCNSFRVSMFSLHLNAHGRQVGLCAVDLWHRFR